jgi:peptidoglycan/xylan/chitin deacetylase (PgdA/CDA1 family)
VRSLLTLLFVLNFSLCYSAKNRVALFDLTTRNAESTAGNIFSVEHLLKVAGLPYQVTTNFSEALDSKLIIFSSNIEISTFTDAEVASIQDYINNGGVAFVTQLKDPRLYSTFGISAYSPLNTKHFSFHFNTSSSPEIFRWLNDNYEKNIILGDSVKYTDVIGTRSYTLTTAMPLALFGDNTVGFSMNKAGQGYGYALGINFRDVVLRNQIIGSYNAGRSYSNGFEPGTDVFMLVIKGIYAHHNPFSAWKHTSGLNSQSSLIITHDVDATTSIRDMMNNFAAYEQANGIRATYFVTTHYMHDSLAKDFWTDYTDDVQKLKTFNHEIASHSVSHVPDFDNETIVPEGSPGNTELMYAPFYNGHFSSNVTVHGETEVSKLLLERITGLTIRSYRTGYLLYNKKLLSILAQKNYIFNSSLSANNVLTAFPFLGHYDLSMSGDISNVLEIPNTISDVFMSDPINETNFSVKANTWINVQKRNAENFAPTILLIHPNRTWKVIAEQILIRGMADNTRIVPFEHFGDYWKARDAFLFDYQVSGDSVITIVIKNSSLPVQADLSLIIDNGQSAKAINVQDESENPITFLKSNWYDNGIILHSTPFKESYTSFAYSTGTELTPPVLYPNPNPGQFSIDFDLMSNGLVQMDIYNSTGSWVESPLNKELPVGHHSYSYKSLTLAAGIYYYRITSPNATLTGKFIVAQ